MNKNTVRKPDLISKKNRIKYIALKYQRKGLERWFSG